jgi:hypothetical protein
MTSQFFPGEIIIFPLVNVPDECRSAVIVKGLITNTSLYTQNVTIWKKNIVTIV